MRSVSPIAAMAPPGGAVRLAESAQRSSSSTHSAARARDNTGPRAEGDIAAARSPLPSSSRSRRRRSRGPASPLRRARGARRGRGAVRSARGTGLIRGRGTLLPPPSSSSSPPSPHSPPPSRGDDRLEQSTAQGGAKPRNHLSHFLAQAATALRIHHSMNPDFSKKLIISSRSCSARRRPHRTNTASK